MVYFQFLEGGDAGVIIIRRLIITIGGGKPQSRSCQTVSLPGENNRSKGRLNGYEEKF